MSTAVFTSQSQANLATTTNMQMHHGATINLFSTYSSYFEKLNVHTIKI